MTTAPCPWCLATDPCHLHPWYCTACQHGGPRHRCTPLERADRLCECFACLPNDHEEPP